MAVAGPPTRFQVSRQWMFPSECGSGFQGDDFTDQLMAMTSSDTVFGFLDSGHGSAESSGSDRFNEEEEECEDDEEEKEGSDEENKVFWENQHKNLKEIVCKSSSIEKEIRNAAKEAMKATNQQGNYCVCRRSVADEDDTCRSCLMREISRRLCDAGYDSAVCKSKWRSSPEIPSGEHTFIEVLDNSNPKKGQIRIIIELNFRAGFEMARANEEYNKLVSRLPEAFVGKAERLRAIIKIISSCAKKCMKDKKMHMGPWKITISSFPYPKKFASNPGKREEFVNSISISEKLGKPYLLLSSDFHPFASSLLRSGYRETEMASEKKMNDSTSFHQSDAPILCANGCGFFGTSATMNLCSKCYRDSKMCEEAMAAVEKSMISIPVSVADKVAEEPVSVALAASSSSEEAAKAVEVAPPVTKTANRCGSCNKKVGVMGFKCRCGSTYCGSHRYPEEHRCSFDFKAVGKDAIAKANPVVKADKMDRL